jgi:hypothetical protein
MTPRAPAQVCEECAGCCSPACFRCQLVAACGPDAVRREAAACGMHVGAVALALATWAVERRLQGARVTVLAIDPAAHPAAPGPADAFAFLTFPVAD